jgi:hypothetical protein
MYENAVVSVHCNVVYGKKTRCSQRSTLYSTVCVYFLKVAR